MTLIQEVNQALKQIKAGAGLSGLGIGDREQAALLGAGAALLLTLAFKKKPATAEDQAAQGVAASTSPYASALSEAGQGLFSAAVGAGTAAGTQAIYTAAGQQAPAGSAAAAGGSGMSSDLILPIAAVGLLLVLSR